MITLTDIVLRLGAAALLGGAIGLNRDLRGKPTGVRTLGLVGLGSAAIVLGAADWMQTGSLDPDISRVIQGVLTGVGFLGAGVILHGPASKRVHGLTTAACTWVTACLGMICGLGHWRIALVSAVLVFLVLILGGPLERAVHALWDKDGPEAPSA